MCLFIPNFIEVILIKNRVERGEYLAVVHNYHQYIAYLVPQPTVYKSPACIRSKVGPISLEISRVLQNYVYSFNLLFLKKVRFKGKGYKINSKPRVALLTFNRAHKMRYLSLDNRMIRRAKQKYILISKNINKSRQAGFTLKSARPINIFTRRGLRLSRQVIFKKVGKKTS